MFDELACLGERHGVDLLEALHQVAVPGPLVRNIGRGVAVEARARLRARLAAGEGLVIEHVGVAAFLAEIEAERRSRPTWL